MKDNFVWVTFVIDESGSMWSKKVDVIGGFNNFIDEQKKESNGDLNVSIYTFSDDVILRVKNQNKDEIKHLTDEDYRPGGCTALYDALGKAITETGEELSKMDEKDRPSKVIVVVMTDGFENASQKFNKSQIKEMIEHQESKYSWSFIYIGESLDSKADADAIGIRMSGCYGSKGTRGFTKMMSNATTAYRSCAVATADTLACNYVQELTNEGTNNVTTTSDANVSSNNDVISTLKRKIK